MRQKKLSPITLRFLHIEKETGKKPKEIAEILEMDLSTYYKTKRGDIPITSNFLVKVEYKLKYSRNWLEFGKGNPKIEDVEFLSDIEKQLSVLSKLKNYDLLPILNALPDIPPNEKDKNLLLDFLNLYVQKFQ
ncbi:DNA-binding protein [Leptospira kirschneri serovar Pomona]|uniref:DNA-binding protein n=2 Tax=Leptospira TaxID=171 RepID=A0A1T1DQ61_9LEPT|nr:MULTISPECIES: hypothetical protein [Leptospira]EKR71845.1 hypothetical protein LEP1GSC041_0536 [Leptospira noguchii str. 2006001870]EMO39557.1 hypothetical protein LEP1GSC186_3218 [Leptospira noguchii serovar Autumnalis str. ZUN142]OOV43014.1 DNA-binding protein [Leptospira kirschneri serovar Pomona]